MLPQGIYVPMVTPFIEGTESVDYDGMTENAAKLCAAGVTGLMPLGSNGEFRSLNDDESLKVLRAVKRGKDPNVTLMVGAGRESAHATIEWIRKCADAGAEKVFVLTPSFFAKTVGEEGLLRFYSAVADHSPVPIVLYAAPVYAGGVELPGKVVKALSSHSNCIGMKDTSKQPVNEYRPYCSNKFQILAGSQGKFFDWMTNGAVGGVLSAANYAPEICVRLMDIYAKTDCTQPHALDLTLQKAGKAISGQYGVAGVKYAADIRGFCGGVARNPFPVLSNTQKADVKQTVDWLMERFAEVC